MTIQKTYIDKTKSILSLGIEWISVLSALYLIASLIFAFKYQRPALSIYAIATVIDIIVNGRYKNLKWDKVKSTFVMMIVFYLCMWTWHIFEDCSSTEFFHSTDTRLPFLVFGIIGLTSSLNPKIEIKHVAYTMLAASLAALTALIVDNYTHIANIKDIDELRHLMPYMRSKTLQVIHIEFNLYLNCTMAMCFIAIFEAKKHAIKVMLALGILLIYTALILNEGRIGFAMANILLLIFYGISIQHYKPKLLIPSLIVAAIAIVILASGHQRLQVDQITQDPRVEIWKLSSHLIAEKPILGYGVCDGREVFIEKCTTEEGLQNFWRNWMNEFPDYKISRFHCHNAFVESTLEFGVIGLTVVILIFLLPILLTKNRRKIYLSLFILIFGAQAMFESFTFHSQITLFCWLIYFFINTKLKNDQI